jgi:hypothetical protein
MPACAGTRAKWEQGIRMFKTFKPFNNRMKGDHEAIG